MSLIKRNPTEKPVIDLNGPEGNAYYLLGTGQKLARQLGIEFAPIEADMTSGDYRHLVETFDNHFGEYIDLILPDNWSTYQ